MIPNSFAQRFQGQPAMPAQGFQQPQPQMPPQMQGQPAQPAQGFLGSNQAPQYGMNPPQPMPPQMNGTPAYPAAGFPGIGAPSQPNAMAAIMQRQQMSPMVNRY